MEPTKAFEHEMVQSDTNTVNTVDDVVTDGSEGRAEDRAQDLAQLLNAGAAFAETLAAMYFKPLTQQQIDALADQNLTDFMGLDEDFDRGINDIVHYLRRRNTGTRQQLACDFTSAFVGTKTYEGKSAVPYESVFTSEDGLMCQGSYHEVIATYKREGLQKDDGLNIPDDHLSYMLEFIGVMARRSADEIIKTDLASAQHDLETVDRFIDVHILSWFDEFDARARLLIETRFYRGVLSMTKGYLTFMRDFVERTIDEMKAIQTSHISTSCPPDIQTAR